MEIHWTLKTAPDTEPITTAEAKTQLAITHDSLDDVIDSFITAARAWVEAYTGRSLYTQTWQLSAADFADRFWLPRAAPLQSITHVKYYDTSNVLQTLATSYYYTPSFFEPAVLERKYAQVWPAVYDRADAVQIEYVTGWDDVTEIPKPLVQAITMIVGHWIVNREAVVSGTISKEIEFAATTLCAPYRVFLRPPSCL